MASTKTRFNPPFFFLKCPVPSQENGHCYIIICFCVCYILVLCFCCVVVLCLWILNSGILLLPLFIPPVKCWNNFRKTTITYRISYDKRDVTCITHTYEMYYYKRDVDIAGLHPQDHVALEYSVPLKLVWNIEHIQIWAHTKILKCRRFIIWNRNKTRVHTLKCLAFFTNHWYYVDSPKYKVFFTNVT